VFSRRIFFTHVACSCKINFLLPRVDLARPRVSPSDLFDPSLIWTESVAKPSPRFGSPFFLFSPFSSSVSVQSLIAANYCNSRTPSSIPVSHFDFTLPRPPPTFFFKVGFLFFPLFRGGLLPSPTLYSRNGGLTNPHLFCVGPFYNFSLDIAAEHL